MRGSDKSRAERAAPYLDTDGERKMKKKKKKIVPLDYVPSTTAVEKQTWADVIVGPHHHAARDGD